MRRNCRTYLTQISIRFASNYGRSAHTRCRKERAPEESTSHRATYLFIFFVPQDFYGKMSHLSVRRIFLSFCANKTICEQHHISGAAAKRGHLRGANLTALRIFLFFCAKKTFLTKTEIIAWKQKSKKVAEPAWFRYHCVLLQKYRL